MKSFNNSLAMFAIVYAIWAGASVANGASSAEAEESTVKLLTANFESRQVVTIKAGDFHFVPGQPAPVHTHVAPAVGYVSKGAILYQVEGEKPQLLQEGEAFYEPAGPRILRFDNASATEEAVFIDFNLQQEGEPFIVFEQELTENIDRRKLPTVELDSQTVNRVDVFVSELEPNAGKTLTTQVPALGYVAEGIVTLTTPDSQARRVIAGESFSLPEDQSTATIVNTSSEVPAKVVSFYLY